MDKFILLTSANTLYLYKYNVQLSKLDDIKRYLPQGSIVKFIWPPSHQTMLWLLLSLSDRAQNDHMEGVWESQDVWALDHMSQANS